MWRQFLTRQYLVIAVSGLLFVAGSLLVWGYYRTMERRIWLSPTAAVSTPSSIGPLLGANAQGTFGDMVFLHNVLLEAGPTPDVFVLSGAENLRMLLVSNAPNSFAEHTPITVDIKGLIRRLPSSATLRKEWKLTKEQIHLFGQQQIYIAAESVKEQQAIAD